MVTGGARRFWDRRARENALFFVDNRLDYVVPDEEYFWSSGEDVLDSMLGLAGVEIRPADRVLDIGCGVGRVTRALAPRAAGVVALDVSPEMLKRARELNPGLDNVDWVQGDGVSLRPLEDASIDGCFSHVVFQHIADPEITLGYVREIGRVLKPGGWALVQVSTDPGVHRRPGVGGVRQLLRVALGRAPRGTNSPEWVGSPVGMPGLRAAASDGGLEIVRLFEAGTQYTTMYARRRS